MWASAVVKAVFCVMVSRITNDPEGQKVRITSTLFSGYQKRCVAGDFDSISAVY